MTLIVLASAKGAPGVTTLTVALAALTPGAVAADLDPDGGDLALRYRRQDGAPLKEDQGLLSLAASLRRDLNDFVGAGPIDAHLQATSGGLDLLLGVNGPDQALGLGPLWAPLARALAESPRLVFADCGRVGPASPALPVLMVADAVILVARAELEELAHLRERLRFLVAALPSRYSGRARVGVVLLAAERDRAAGARTEQLLRSSGVPVSVLGTVADDARGAARLRGAAHGSAGRTTLIRSVRSLLPAVRVLAGDVPEMTQYRPGLTSAPPALPEPMPEPLPEPMPEPLREPASPAHVGPAHLAPNHVAPADFGPEPEWNGLQPETEPEAELLPPEAELLPPEPELLPPEPELLPPEPELLEPGAEQLPPEELLEPDQVLEPDPARDHPHRYAGPPLQGPYRPTLLPSPQDQAARHDVPASISRPGGE